ncbi:MAG: hypothetical protein IPP14_13385 [Planctomycetes bacterium]|nr:hypothetical protein [Planctomycetota bacterium]
MADLSDDFVLTRFAHLYDQYFDRFAIRRDAEGNRFLHCEFSHPRFKRTFVPVVFCGVAVRCVPTEKAAVAAR